MSRFRLDYTSLQIKRNKFYFNPNEVINENLLRSVHHVYETDVDDYDPNDFGLLFFDRFNRLPFEDFTITPDYHLQPTRLAFDLYGDPDYWWFLMLFNKFEDWNDFQSGRKIKTITQSFLESFIANHVTFKNREKKRRRLT